MRRWPKNWCVLSERKWKLGRRKPYGSWGCFFRPYQFVYIGQPSDKIESTLPVFTKLWQHLNDDNPAELGQRELNHLLLVNKKSKRWGEGGGYEENKDKIANRSERKPIIAPDSHHVTLDWINHPHFFFLVCFCVYFLYHFCLDYVSHGQDCQSGGIVETNISFYGGEGKLATV